MPLLSVVTPTFNSARYLEDCLRSVAALAVDHEHIVIDGGSADQTVALLEACDGGRLRWVSEPDRGQTHAVNKGLAMAGGTYVMWLNGDDELVPDAVAEAVAHLEAHADCRAVYGGLLVVSADGEERRDCPAPSWSWRRYLYFGDFLSTPTVVFRREALSAVGLLDETWADAADYDFYLRLTHGARIDPLPRTHVRFRWHEDSKTARDVETQQAEALAIRRRWARGPLDSAAMSIIHHAKCAVLPIVTRGRWPRMVDV